MTFDYSKLRGRVKEICNTQENFACALGISTVSLSAKLNNKSPFTQSEIDKACKILGITSEEISDYFFTTKVKIF